MKQTWCKINSGLGFKPQTFGEGTGQQRRLSQSDALRMEAPRNRATVMNGGEAALCPWTPHINPARLISFHKWGIRSGKWSLSPRSHSSGLSSIKCCLGCEVWAVDITGHKAKLASFGPAPAAEALSPTISPSSLFEPHLCVRRLQSSHTSSLTENNPVRHYVQKSEQLGHQQWLGNCWWLAAVGSHCYPGGTEDLKQVPRTANPKDAEMGGADSSRSLSALWGHRVKLQLLPNQPWQQPPLLSPTGGGFRWQRARESQLSPSFQISFKSHVQT